MCVCGNKIGVKQALNNYGHLQQYYEFIACMYLHVHVHVHCMDITSSIIILFIACMDITFVQDAQCVCVGIKLVLNKLLIIMDISSSIMHACIYMYMYIVQIHLYNNSMHSNGRKGSIIQPLCTHVAGVLYFVLRYFTDKYNIYYFYRPSPFNGRQFLHRSAINFVIVGAVHLQILTLFFSVVRLGELCNSK